MSKENYRALAQIGGLLAVLACSILAAIVFIVGGLRFFDAPRVYRAGDLFPSPETAFQLAYSQKPMQAIRARAYRFDHVAVDEVEVSEGQYTTFYNLIAEDKSLLQSHDFVAIDAIQLRIYVKDLEDSKTSPFAEMQLSGKGDEYRILLRDQSAEKHWIYFSHPQIRQKAVQIFSN